MSILRNLGKDGTMKKIECKTCGFPTTPDKNPCDACRAVWCAHDREWLLKQIRAGKENVFLYERKCSNGIQFKNCNRNCLVFQRLWAGLPEWQNV